MVIKCAILKCRISKCKAELASVDRQVWAAGLASVGLITNRCGIPSDGLTKCGIYVALRFDQLTSCKLRPDNYSI